MAADPPSLTAKVAPPAMAFDLADNKLEKELDINYECTLESIERKDRTVKIKKWLQSCKKCSEKAVSENEEMLFLTSRESLEHWL